MKVAAISSMLVLAAATAHCVSAAECQVPALSAALTSIIEPAYACETTTGLQLLPPVSLPTTTQVAAICSSCQPLIADAKAIVFPDCTITISGQAVPIATLFEQIVAQCPATATVTPTDTVNTTVAPIATNSTGSPTSEKTKPGSGSGATSTDGVAAAAASPTTAAPKTSATTSGATGATVVAVASWIAAFVL